MQPKTFGDLMQYACCMQYSKAQRPAMEFYLVNKKGQKTKQKKNIIPKHRKHCARILRTNIHSTTQTNKICKFASPYYYMVFALSWIESIGHWFAEYFQKKNKRETNLVVNIRALSRFCAICQIKCGETAFIRLEQCLCVAHKVQKGRRQITMSCSTQS